MSRAKQEYKKPKSITRLDMETYTAVLNKLIGQRLQSLRKACNMPMDVVGELLMDVTGQQVSRYERGLTAIHLPAWIVFLLALKITPNQFIQPIMTTLMWWEKTGQKQGIKLDDIHLGMETLFTK